VHRRDRNYFQACLLAHLAAASEASVPGEAGASIERFVILRSDEPRSACPPRLASTPESPDLISNGPWPKELPGW
jgi:hypothetical protein